MMKSSCLAFILSVSIISISSAIGNATTVSADDFQLVGPDGKVMARLTSSSEGTPGLFFFDKQGRNRMNLFLYPEGYGGIVLNDANKKAVGIFRMHGSTGRPVLVFKNNGEDRMVMGLRDDDTHAPYIDPLPAGPAKSEEKSPTPLATLLLSLAVGFGGGIVGSRLSRKS